jgi:hypothetical protein
MASERFDIVTSGPVTFAWEDAPCNGYRIIGTAEAHGTHIGDKATFSTKECARPDYEAGVNHVDGEAVVTATSGDEIFIHYGGDSPVPDMKTGDFHDDLEFSITGGSGSFDGATGSGRLTAHGNINDNPTIVESHLEGTIDLQPA